MTNHWHLKFTIMAIVVVFCATNTARADQTKTTKQEIFVPGVGGYKAYRIPALITTKNNTVLAFCEGRKTGRGDSGNIDLIVKRSADGGKTWSSGTVIWDDGNNTCGNPCPVVDEQTGDIHLLMTWNRGDDSGGALHNGTATGTRNVFQCKSQDDGRTWSHPAEITNQVKEKNWQWYATGPGVGIQIKTGPHAGRLVIPCDHTAPVYHFGAHVIYSDDGGETWNRSNPIKPTCNESQIVELNDGRLMMNMRSQENKAAGRLRNGYRSIALSNDGGETWTEPTFDEHLGDPVCQASIIRYDEGRLLFSHPNPPITPQRGKRIRMTIRSSQDDGKTWSDGLLIDEGAAAYSCLTRLPDGNIGLLYESGTSITMAIVPISELDKSLSK